MCSSDLEVAPHATKNLSVAVANEEGAYVCWAGMWWTPENKLAYLEPLCTIPEYRHKGLAAAALSELYRKTKALGATHMSGGESEFYRKIGYIPAVKWTFWKKETEYEVYNNPWNEITLTDYESHMSLASIMQLQALNKLIKGQLKAWPVSSTMILGIAGGNGLEHIRDSGIKKVYGVDINAAYLSETSVRYQDLGNILELLCIDLHKCSGKLPGAELLIANLLVEYIGCGCFRQVVQQVEPKYVSCVIQVNTAYMLSLMAILHDNSPGVPFSERRGLLLQRLEHDRAALGEDSGTHRRQQGEQQDREGQRGPARRLTAQPVQPARRGQRRHRDEHSQGGSQRLLDDHGLIDRVQLGEGQPHQHPKQGVAYREEQRGNQKRGALPQLESQRDGDARPGNYGTGEGEQQLEPYLDPQQRTARHGSLPQNPEVLPLQADGRGGDGAGTQAEADHSRRHRQQGETFHTDKGKQLFPHHQGCRSGGQQHNQAKAGIPEVHGRAKEPLGLLPQKGLLLTGGGLGGELIVALGRSGGEGCDCLPVDPA